MNRENDKCKNEWYIIFSKLNDSVSKSKIELLRNNSCTFVKNIYTFSVFVFRQTAFTFATCRERIH